MAELVELRHARTGARYSVPEELVPAAERNGFERYDPTAAPDTDEDTPEEEETLEEEETSEEEVNLSELTNDELRDRLEARDLPTSGNKDELVARLENAE